MKGFLVSPSLLAADFSSLAEAAALAESSGADRLHFDVMDGVFVPSITLGHKALGDIRKRTRLPMDAHLMVVEPERKALDFVEAGADSITFHIEACVHAHRLVERLREAKVETGISIVPSSPISLLECLLPGVDRVLVMTVDPGLGGQALIPECLSKVEQLNELRKTKGYHYKIEVDGGVNQDTIKDLARAGSDIFVAGSAFFGAKDPRAAMAGLRKALLEA